MKTQLQRYWHGANPVERLLVIQAGGYLLLEILSLVCGLLQPLRWWELASALSFYPELGTLVRAPWRLVTYILPHQHLIHLLANLALIYFLLPPVLRFFGRGRLVTLYVAGAVAGALAYALGYYLLQSCGVAILPLGLRGCSSAILACLTAYLVQPQGLRQLRLQASRWLLLMVLLVVTFGGASTNLGGTLAHVGGLLLGLFYGWRYRQGRDPLMPLLRRFRKALPPETKTDAALRMKLRHSGYASLTPQERARLRELHEPRS